MSSDACRSAWIDGGVIPALVDNVAKTSLKDHVSLLQSHVSILSRILAESGQQADEQARLFIRCMCRSLSGNRKGTLPLLYLLQSSFLHGNIAQVSVGCQPLSLSLSYAV